MECNRSLRRRKAAISYASFDVVFYFVPSFCLLNSTNTFYARHPLTHPTTVKEYVRSQQYPRGSRQWYQEGQEDQIRFYTRNGPKVLEKPKVRQEIQRFQARERLIEFYQLIYE